MARRPKPPPFEILFSMCPKNGSQGNLNINLPEEMGPPRWEVAVNEMGRRIYHRRWEVQDGKW
jgi:hypothetical protein